MRSWGVQDLIENNIVKSPSPLLLGILGLRAKRPARRERRKAICKEEEVRGVSVRSFACSIIAFAVRTLESFLRRAAMMPS